MSTAKSIVPNNLASLSLDRNNNYDQWLRKIKYLLSENDSIDLITDYVKPLSENNAAKI